jgi:CRISPR-associated protein Cas5 subtype I-B
MECLKLKLYSPVGIFKNPLSMKGIEIYPLPPYSTIIGLIYKAIGRKWNGEYFQISIQGDYETIFRDYIWFKKYNLKEKELEKLPLQVPILYNLNLIIHISAEENLLSEIENALKNPKELLFLSGGEYPVKIEEVKRVKYQEKKVSEYDSVELKYNAYIPDELLKERKISATDDGILFNLSYFYENQTKPKTYSWINARYFQKGTSIYGNLLVDDDEDPLFLSPENPNRFSNVKSLSSDNEIKFYANNWLMASACVGVLKVLEWYSKNENLEIKKFVEENILKLPENIWSKLPEIYAAYLVKDGKEILKKSYESQKDKDKFNPYNTLILKFLGDFHKNSPFTNQSHDYIERLKGTYEPGKEEEAIENVKKSFSDAYSEFLKKKIDLSFPCFFCHERTAENFLDATNFTPLFASPETVRNFFWDPIPICKKCEFLLYFSSVGFSKSGGKYLFVYIPTDLLETYISNSTLSVGEKIEKEKLGLFWSVVDRIIKEEKQKSTWILQNIYFVEIEKVGDATSNIYSFHIHPRLAKVIREKIDKYPKNLNRIFSDFLFYIYTGRSLYEFLFLLVSGFVRGKSYENIETKTTESKIISAGKSLKSLNKNLTFFIEFQETLNGRGVSTMNYIDWAYQEGKKLKANYISTMGKEKAKKKVETLTYRLLDTVRRKDKEHFAQNIIRAYLEVEKEIPYLFKEALKDEEFNMIAYSFIIGLNSQERKEEKELESDENRENSETSE